MTFFENFRENCKHIKYFYFQIVFKDYTLIIIDNDLQELFSVNENDIFYFHGCWKDFRLRWFSKTSSDYKVTRHTNIFKPVFYGISIVHILFDKGIDVEIIEPFIPQLIESYGHDCKEEIIGWETKRDLITGLSSNDKILFKKAEKLIIEFDWLIGAESAVSGERQWCMIVQNTIQIVRNNGGLNAVINYLAKYGGLNIWSWETEEEALEAREKHRIEVAEKIVELIKESD